MKAITTRFLGPTDWHGSRILATDEDGNRVTVPYDYGSPAPHRVAAQALCKKLGWTGLLVEGSLKRGQVFVFYSPDDTFVAIPSHPCAFNPCPAEQEDSSGT